MAMGQAYASMLTPRLQQALEKGCRQLLDDGFEDRVAIRLGKSFVNDCALATYLPGCYYWKYTYAFLQDFLLCVGIVGWKLAQPARVQLACVAEELAAHALITEADLYLDRDRGRDEPFINHFDELEAHLYSDVDFMPLFESNLIGVEEAQRSQALGNPLLAFERWFDPFPCEPLGPISAVPSYLHIREEAGNK
jgi:hypothetical protein